MKYKEIEKLALQELKDKILEERVTLRNLRFSHAVSPIENPLKIKNARRDIAKLLTNLKVREKKKA